MLKKLFLAALLMLPASAWADGCISPPTTNFSSLPITVTTGATLIAVKRCRNAITIINAGSTTLYLGNSSAVTTSNAGGLPPGATITLQTNSTVYGISTASDVISVFETY